MHNFLKCISHSIFLNLQKTNSGVRTTLTATVAQTRAATHVRRAIEQKLEEKVESEEILYFGICQSRSNFEINASNLSFGVNTVVPLVMF